MCACLCAHSWARSGPALTNKNTMQDICVKKGKGNRQDNFLNNILYLKIAYPTYFKGKNPCKICKIFTIYISFTEFSKRSEHFALTTQLSVDQGHFKRSVATVVPRCPVGPRWAGGRLIRS